MKKQKLFILTNHDNLLIFQSRQLFILYSECSIYSCQYCSCRPLKYIQIILVIDPSGASHYLNVVIEHQEIVSVSLKKFYGVLGLEIFKLDEDIWPS